jgi:hypothetical protein
MKRGFLDLLDPSNDPEFFWQVISGPPCILSLNKNLISQPEKLWSYINKIKEHSRIPGIMLQNDTVLDSLPSIVNGFAMHFRSVFSNPASDHGISDLDYSTLSNNLILNFFCESDVGIWSHRFIKRFVYYGSGYVSVIYG